MFQGPIPPHTPLPKRNWRPPSNSGSPPHVPTYFNNSPLSCQARFRIASATSNASPRSCSIVGSIPRISQAHLICLTVSRNTPFSVRIARHLVHIVRSLASHALWAYPSSFRVPWPCRLASGPLVLACPFGSSLGRGCFWVSVALTLFVVRLCSQDICAHPC